MMDFEKWTYPQFKTLMVACVMWCVIGFLVGRWSVGTPKLSGPLMGAKNPYADPAASMPSPYPIQRPGIKAIFGTAEMGRDGLTTLRLRPFDGGSANWDLRLFGSEEPVMGEAAPEAPEN